LKYGYRNSVNKAAAQKSLKMAQPNILIVEDEPLIAEDIADLCQFKGYAVCGTAYNAGQALIMIKENKPNLVLLDINLNDEIDGTDIADYLNTQVKIPFIYITSYSDKNTIEKVKATQPLGYIVKPFNKEQIYSTIELGWSIIQKPEVADFDLEKINGKLLVAIGDREAEILSSVVKGLDTRQIAEAHFISTNTVKYHLKNLYDKLNVHNRVELVYRLSELSKDS
jgi:two-component system, response regulator PdtaR